MSTVVERNHDISGNGGRKLVRLINGWLVVATIKPSYPYRVIFYVSKNQGSTWTELCYLDYESSSIADIALVSKGTTVYFISANQTSSVYRGSFDALTVNNSATVPGTTTLDGNQKGIGKLSLAINPEGTEIHAAWSSKNPQYPNVFNISYAKATIYGDGSVTWGQIEQVTRSSSTGNEFINPVIVLKINNEPIIFYTYTGEQRVMCNYKTNGVWKSGDTTIYLHGYTIYNGGIYAQASPSAAVDKNGTIHVTWHGKDGSDNSKFNIRYSKSLDGGLTWITPIKLTTGNILDNTDPSITIDKTDVPIIVYSGTIQASHVFAAIKKLTLVNDTWTNTTITNQTDNLMSNPSALYDPTFEIAFGEIPPIIYKDSVKQSIEYTGTYLTNTAPTASLVSPTNNQTLYENDVINISGEAYDANKDQSVTVFYQINSEPRKVLAINASLTQITLSKQLTFKNGKIYDGEVALTGTLTEGVAHTLKVWAVDSENGQSATIERTFYVIPNRAPLISIDAVVPSGIVNTDKFKISGTASDQDANSSVKVNYRINGANPIEIYDGTGGAWEFEVSLGQLKVGENIIVVEVIDNYGAKTSKTIKLNKNTVNTPILQSVARYKISPPKGSARGVLIWVQRDEDLDLTVELSMTLAGEQEQYILLEADPENIVEVSEGIVEDEYYHETVEPKDNIILKLTTSRANVNIDNKIYLIWGVLE